MEQGRKGTGERKESHKQRKKDREGRGGGNGVVGIGGEIVDGDGPEPEPRSSTDKPSIPPGRGVPQPSTGEGVMVYDVLGEDRRNE